MTLFKGKLAATPIEGAIPFHVVRAVFVKAGGVLPARPKDWGHAGALGDGSELQGGYGMLGNGPCDDGSIEQVWAAFEGAGDCAWAGPGHEEELFAKITGRAIPRFTCLNILQDNYAPYVASSNNGQGYDLQTGANDTGSNVADVIKIRQTSGLVDADGNKHLIGKAFEGTPGNLDEAFEMAYLLDVAGLGFNMTQAQMDQFNNGEPWDYVAGSPDDGGHYVPLLGKRVVSWSRPQRFTDAFFEKQNDELNSYLTNAVYNSVTGETAEHFTEQDEEKFFVLLAQKQQAAA